MDAIRSHNATMVALTPQLAEHSRTMVEKHDLGFDLLSDPGNAYAAELGLRFAFPDDLRQEYLAMNIDLPVHNGEDSWTMPMPARLVVDPDGIVRAADIDPDYRYRPEPQKTLDDLAALG